MSAADRFAPNEARREALEKLRAFVSKLGDGVRVGHVEIEKATGVKMDRYGQELWRLTCKRLKRPTLTIVGFGYEMSSASNAEDIAGTKNRRVLNAVDVAKETLDELASRHLDEMSADQRQRITHNLALLGTLSLSASLAKKLPAKK